jgi:hypothetical protein
MGHERVIPLPGNHFEIVKFASSRDPNYNAVVNNIVRLVKEPRVDFKTDSEEKIQKVSGRPALSS